MEISITLQGILTGHKGQIGTVEFSPLMPMLASHSKFSTVHSRAGFDSNIIFWDLNTGDQLFTLNGGITYLAAIAFSPTENMLASGNDHGAVKIWDLKSRESKFGLGGHRDPIESIVFSPDGNFVVVGLMGKEVKMYNVKSRQLMRTFKKEFHDAFSLTFSLDGTQIACGGDEFIAIWDVETGEIVNTCSGFKYFIHSVCYSPDGAYLASGGIDSIVRIWNADTCDLINQLSGHEAPVMSLAFICHEHPVLISASMDKSIVFWDYEKGEILARFQVHDEGVTCMALSSDGKILATGSNDSTIKLWQISIID